MKEKPNIRPAIPDDARSIQEILAYYAGQKQLLLPRTLEDILEHIKNFFVAEINGEFAGCVAVRDYGNSLYEVRSLAILPDLKKHGIGSLLVSGIIDDFRKKGKSRLFALTYSSGFFIKLGFHQVEKETFPEKIWSDCSICPKKDNCDEDALMMEFE